MASPFYDEEFSCRKNSSGVYALKEGNGSGHVLLVRGNGVGLNLEDMAGGRVGPAHRSTVPVLILACIFSVAIMGLLAIGNFQEWLLAVLFLGMVQNVIVAKAPRSAAALGFNFEESRVIYQDKVEDALNEAEKEVDSAGLCKSLFFPGKESRDGHDKLMDEKWA